MTSLTIIIRMDVFAIFYGIWLGAFLCLKRTTIAKIWISYLLYVSLLLPFQYLLCLGLPSVLCYQYPWSKAALPSDLENLFDNLRTWMYLPDYDNSPQSSYLIADFFQLFFVWLQHAVFQIENSEKINTTAENSSNNSEFKITDIGGKNNELVYESVPYENNPFNDFISEAKTNLDKLKYIIYMYSYWVVLAIVFLTGTSRISILCLGYVILSFFFLWYGQTFLMKPLDKLLKRLKYFILVFLNEISTPTVSINEKAESDKMLELVVLSPYFSALNTE
jgi:hypothetical protein